MLQFSSQNDFIGYLGTVPKESKVSLVTSKLQVLLVKLGYILFYDCLLIFNN